MKVTISDDSGHPVDNISWPDPELNEEDIGDLVAVIAEMVHDYHKSILLINAMKENRRRRQEQVNKGLSNREHEKEDVPF